VSVRSSSTSASPAMALHALSPALTGPSSSPPSSSSLGLLPLLPASAARIPHKVLQIDLAGLRRRRDAEEQHRGMMGRVPSKGARPSGAAAAGQRWGRRRMDEALYPSGTRGFGRRLVFPVTLQ
jgi:hypothetical protein